MEVSTKESLNDELSWATGELDSKVQEAFQNIIQLHLANTAEYLPDALTHLVSYDARGVVKALLDDIWTDAVGEVMGELQGHLTTEPGRSRGVTEGIAA